LAQKPQPMMAMRVFIYIWLFGYLGIWLFVCRTLKSPNKQK
jgi:hypothetical protein